MYSPFETVFKYIHYWVTASNGKGHGTHSPFIFEFITTVLNDRKHYPEYEKVEALRSRMLNDHREVSFDDPGAGSAISKTKTRKVSSIARHAAKSPKLGQLLFRMVRKYEPATVLELGTSLGITSSYLKLAQPNSVLYTIEGAEPVAAIAKENLESLLPGSFKLINANFDEELPSLLKRMDNPDFVFVDGNHREEPTIKYFRQILPYIKDDSIIVFDDIHWSREMENAWKEIKNHPSVTMTVDLYYMGIVLFREGGQVQHFKLKF